MKNLTTTAAFLTCSAFFLQPAAAKELSEVDREALLASFERLNEGFDSKSSGRAAPALAAYRAAMSSDEAATAFYLKCVEKVDFTDMKRKSNEFREWRQTGCQYLTEPGYGLALRHQLRWLVLTIMASTGGTDPAKLAVEAQETMDALSADFPKLGDAQGILHQPVTQSIFARAFDFQRLQVAEWPLIPADVQNIYQTVILEPSRKAADAPKLQAGWTKCIQQLTAQGQGSDLRDKKKGAPSPETRLAAHQKFLDQEVPELRWKMEMDLYKAGDQEGATTRMMGHLEKFFAHSSWRTWASEFKLLMKPEKPAQKQVPKAAKIEDFE